MAADPDNSISIKILYDKEKNQVVCAEASSDFIDILFSFLTLPMGTIARLIQRQKSTDSTQIGFMNLYQSVKDISLENFSTDPCKEMLMYPRSSLETICKDLKVKFDDTPMKYFLCADVSCSARKLSYYKDANCSCKKLLNREVSGEGDGVIELSPNNEIVEVFVKSSTPYVITDDIRIMHGTPGVLLELFRERGIDNVDIVEEKFLKVGCKEILNLLAHIIVSKTPLTDSFLPIQKLNSEKVPIKERGNQLTSNGTSVTVSGRLEIKIFVRKSNKKPLYAEATEDFVELLLSFLTFPLSNVVNCLTGNSSLECVDNLYKSVERLEDKWFVEANSKKHYRSSLSKNLLLNPGIAPDFICRYMTLKLCDTRDKEIDGMLVSTKGEVRPFKYSIDGQYRKPGEVQVKVTNPKDPKGDYSHPSFFKKPAVFLVSDCLVVKPCDNANFIISFLKGFDVRIDDIEEHTVKIGKHEALSILKASLTTNSAFAPIIELILKQRKRDDSEIILD